MSTALPPRLARRTRIDAARNVVTLAQHRAVTPAEWDRVEVAYCILEDSVRDTDDVSEAAALAVLGVSALAAQPQPTHGWGVRFRVSGRTGETYELRRFGWRWACSCVGYLKGRTCKHAKAEEAWDREHVLAERVGS